MTREDEILKYLEDFKAEFRSLYSMDLDIRIKNIPDKYKFNAEEFINHVETLVSKDHTVPKYARINGLRSRMRCRQLVLYRQCLCKILYSRNYKLHQIAKLLNYKCHATAIHGIKTLDNLLEMNNLEAHNLYNKIIYELKKMYYIESDPSRD